MTLASNDIDWAKVPVAHMIGGIKRYVERGIPPGHFLTALLSNDLMGAVGRADEENLAALTRWAIFIRWELPSGCHGSPERVKDWIEQRGLEGLELEEQAQNDQE